MSKTKQHQFRKEPPKSRKKRFWIVSMIILAVVFSGYQFMVASSENKTSSVDDENKIMTPSKLNGRWLRPDGGYVLQITGADSNGYLTAQYFNPRPINVSSARWKVSNGRLDIFVELRDVNYPGSTYTLTYDLTSDRMRGIYYQAAIEQQFEVEFVRLK